METFKMFLIELHLNFKDKDGFLEILLYGLKRIQNPPPQNPILHLHMSLSFILPNQWSMIITLLSPNSLIKLNLHSHLDTEM